MITLLLLFAVSIVLIMGFVSIFAFATGIIAKIIFGSADMILMLLIVFFFC